MRETASGCETMMAEPAILETNRTPLAQEHLAAGAKLTLYHGAEVPLSFGDSTAEHQAVRRAAGLFDFSFRSKFTLAGEHRVRFLHRIVSNDIQALTPGQGTYVTLLSAQGRILADLRIYVDEDRVWVDTDADIAEKAMRTLQRYIIGDRVQIEPSELKALAVQGPQARAAVEALWGQNLPPLEQEMAHRSFSSEGEPARVVRLSSTGEEGYEIWLNGAALKTVWRSAAALPTATSPVPCGTESLEMLRIEAGIARYGPDLGEDTLPLEAGLLSALSFNKGCYIGQEIIERARSRGHVNWKLMGVRFDPASAAPEPGEALTHEGKTIGEITSACYSPSLARPIALAYLRREAAEPGARLQLASGGGGEVCGLPFLKGPLSPGPA